MGITKSESFTRAQNRVAELAKAFAHPARVAIIEHLLREKSCICNDLVEVLPLSQAIVSQHLQELKKIGLIQGEVNPPKVCYCINEEVWQEFATTFQSIFDSFSSAKHCC